MTASAPHTPPHRARTIHPPAFLLLVDAENCIHTHADADIPFAPSRIMDAARSYGTIAFAYALGNFQAIAQEVREQLHLAGADILVNVHGPRLRDRSDGKDTTDETLQALVVRHLRHARIDGVIFVTDDRNFAPIMQVVLDTPGRKRGAHMRCIRISLRGASALDRVGEVLVLSDGADADMGASRRKWRPDLLIGDLRALHTLPPDEHRALIQRMQLRSPVASRVLRTYIRKIIGRIVRRYGADRTEAYNYGFGFRRMLGFLEESLLSDDRADVSADDLRAFLTALLEVGVLLQGRRTFSNGNERTTYRFNLAHPYVAWATADFTERRRANGAPVGAKGITYSAE